MVNVIGIDHLAIRVSDLERSRVFYVIRIMARARWPEA
jgi:extradiol dioxygenase family protein